MENEQPKVKEDQHAPQQPGTGESYQQKWNYDEIPDLNRLKAAVTPQVDQPSQKAKRLQRTGVGLRGQAGLVEHTPATTRPTRARGRPNETPPFLSIGNANTSEKTLGESKSRQKTSSIPHGVKVPHNTPSMMSNTTPMSGNARARSANRPRSINSSCWNNLVPRKYKNLSSIPDLTANENKWTKTPFKQSRTGQNDSVTRRPRSPGQTLKEKTTLATYHVARIIAKQAAMPEKIHKGKLVKAHLQPLVPVNVHGPTIDQCQGIVSGTMGVSEWTADHAYDTKTTWKKKRSPPIPPQQDYIWDDIATSSGHESRRFGGSRTLQRRRHIMAMMSHDFLYERPQTGESIHCTSIASDLTETRDSELKSELDQMDGSGTDSEHVTNATEINHAGKLVHRKTKPKTQPIPQPASVETSKDQSPGGATDDMIPGKSRDGSQCNKITVIPSADYPQNDAHQEMDDTKPQKVIPDAEGDEGHTEAGKHSELLKLADKDGERPVDSVQYPKPGLLQRKLTAIERPQSVPQKAVHFLDDEPTSDARPAQRSKSAHPRITGRERSKQRENSMGSRKNGSGIRRKHAPVECKTEGLGCEGSHRKDQDDDGGTGGGSDSVPPRSNTGVAPSHGGESGNGGTTGSGVCDNGGSQGKQQGLRTWTGVSDNHENREKTQSLGLQEAIIIRASGGRQDGLLVDDASNALVVVSKNPPSVDKSPPQSSKAGDGKLQNCSTASKPPRKPRAKTAGSVMHAARKHTDTKRSRRPHTAHSSSVTLDLEFTHDPKQEIVAHGDLCFVSSQPVVTRTKTALHSATTNKHSEKTSQIEKGVTMGEHIKVGVCSGCSKTSMIIGDCQQALCSNCLLKVNTTKAMESEAADIHRHGERRQDLRRPGGKEFETIAEVTSIDSDYCSNGDDNTFMTCFSDLEESLLLTRQEIQAEMKLTHTESDLTLIAVDKDSEPDKGSDDSLTKDVEDDVDGVLARCYEDCISVTGMVGGISEYLTNTEYYKSMKTKQCSETATVHRAPISQISAKTTGRSEAEFGKDVKSGDVSSYEVMLMRNYSTNVDVPTEEEDEEEDPPFLEMMCQCLPEPAKTPETASRDRIPDLRKLSINAQVMPLSKPRNQPNLQDPIAKYPPVCFRVNARPPDNHLYYFAYGMDMNPDRFSTYIKRDVDSRLWGLLFGFQLKFNKTGADVGGGCFPNIEFNPYSSVEGCLYVITEDELQILDKCVGFPESLERVVLPVWMLNCAEPDELGIAQYCVAAVTYVAKDQCTRQDDTTELCSDYALDQCLHCSDLLTPAYKEYLRGKRPSVMTTV